LVFALKTSVENLKRGKRLGELDVDWGIILKTIWDMCVCGLDSAGSGSSAGMLWTR